MMDFGCSGMGLMLYRRVQWMVDEVQGPVRETPSDARLPDGSIQKVIQKPEGWRLTETRKGDEVAFSYSNDVSIGGQYYTFETLLTKNEKNWSLRYVNRLWQNGRVVVESDRANCDQYMYFKIDGRELNILTSMSHPKVDLFEKAAQIVLGLDHQPSYTPFIVCVGGGCLF